MNVDIFCFIIMFYVASLASQQICPAGGHESTTVLCPLNFSRFNYCTVVLSVMNSVPGNFYCNLNTLEESRGLQSGKLVVA